MKIASKLRISMIMGFLLLISFNCGNILASDNLHLQAGEITSPASGATWYTGSTYSITWDHTALESSSVEIYLYAGTSQDRAITYSTSNDGSYSWTVSTSISDGSNYKIRIVEDTLFSPEYIESYTFTIMERKTITLTDPESDDIWYTGEDYTIRWSHTGSISSVKIELYLDGTKVSTISSSTPCDGSYSWEVPSGLADSKEYTIRISSTLDSSVYDDSPEFEIHTKTILEIMEPYIPILRTNFYYMLLHPIAIVLIVSMIIVLFAYVRIKAKFKRELF